jgi:hypothetical protein
VKRPRSKSQTPCVPGQRREIVVQDPIVTQENTCRGINGDVLERLRVHMFIELLRAQQGYYTPQRRPDTDPAVVFGAAKLQQHRALADEFVEACRMTCIRSTAPPPPPSEDLAGQDNSHAADVATRQRHPQEKHGNDVSPPKHAQASRWTDAESTLLW